MKKIWILVAICLMTVSFALFVNYHENNNSKNNAKLSTTNESTLTPTSTLAPQKPLTTSVFVPYWADFSEGITLDEYDRTIYFGVNANLNGIDTSDTGYMNIDKFIKHSSSGKKKYLTVKMINSDANIAILKNRSSWDKIVDQSIDLAKKQGFEGIVLDLEISGFIMEDVKNNINNFVSNYYAHAKNNDINFSLAIYGDVFYRRRGFDVAALTKSCDEIMVMAYDFHKSGGEPGPNFPYDKKDKYDYDFQEMVSDFSNYVPVDKLTVIFGMYGYDWQVDGKKHPITQAQALTLNEIRKKFLNACQWKDCVVTKDPNSKETEVNYVMSEMVDDFATMYYHIVWFEDEESAKVKTNYLQTSGINSVAYWAYSYF